MEIVLKEEAYHLFSSFLTLSKVIFLCVCVSVCVRVCVCVCVFCLYALFVFVFFVLLRRTSSYSLLSANM